MYDRGTEEKVNCELFFCLHHLNRWTAVSGCIHKPSHRSHTKFYGINCTCYTPDLFKCMPSGLLYCYNSQGKGGEEKTWKRRNGGEGKKRGE